MRLPPARALDLLDILRDAGAEPGHPTSNCKQTLEVSIASRVAYSCTHLATSPECSMHCVWGEPFNGQRNGQRNGHRAVANPANPTPSNQRPMHWHRHPPTCQFSHSRSSASGPSRAAVSRKSPLVWVVWISSVCTRIAWSEAQVTCSGRGRAAAQGVTLHACSSSSCRSIVAITIMAVMIILLRS